MPIINGTEASETLTGFGGSDNIIGYGGSDTLRGVGGNDVLRGGEGADTLDGGADRDAADYSDSDVGVMVSLISGRGFNGTAAGDRLVSIESLMGSRHDDWFVGNDEINSLYGREGNDVLKGGGGDDFLYGGAGGDTLDGEGGVDGVSYYDSPVGVAISLIDDMAHGGFAEGDNLDNIETVYGSEHDDDLWGDDGGNVLHGARGEDTLKGYGGSDTLIGGDANDLLYGMNGVDTLYGQRDNDWLYGGELGDFLYGQSHDDHLYGENGDDTLDGGDGHDILFGGANGDTMIGGIGFMDVLNGEAGADTFRFATPEECGLTRVSADQLPDFSAAEGDTIHLSAIDANTLLGGDQSFLFIGNNNDFYVDADPRGQLRYMSEGYLEGDVNGDQVADFFIAINPTLTPTMAESSLVL
jgi:serralysin